MRHRIYQKQELALLYFPGRSAKVATNNLLRMMKYNKKLMVAIEELGYNPRLHYFTIEQVKLIDKHLGSPD